MDAGWHGIGDRRRRRFQRPRGHQRKGEVYVTDPPNKRVWFIDAKGGKRVVYEAKGREGIQFPNGVRLSPDQSLLLVADYANKWVWSFQIQPDGSLANGAAVLPPGDARRFVHGGGRTA